MQRAHILNNTFSTRQDFLALTLQSVNGASQKNASSYVLLLSLGQLEMFDNTDLCNFYFKHLSLDFIPLDAALQRDSWHLFQPGYHKFEKEDCLLGLTCCHIADLLYFMTGLTVLASAIYDEYLIAPGSGANQQGITALTKRFKFSILRIG